MLDLSIDRDLDARLDQVRRLGREHLRPLGVEERPASGPRTGARRGVVLAEEMSYWDRGMSVAMPGLGLGGPPLLGMGTPEQKERFLSPFRDRERPHWAAFAMTEPGAGSDVAAIQTTAVRAGDAWVLNGAKTFISNSMRADWIVVWATVDRSAGRAGHRAFVVARHAGARGHALRAQDGPHRLRELVVHAARLPRAGGEPARWRAPLRGARRLQGRDEELQRHPPRDRGDGGRHRPRRLRRVPRLRARPLRARPRHPALPAGAREARAHGPEDRGGPAPLLARGVPGGPGAAERNRGLDGEGVRGRHGAGGDRPGGRDPGRRGRHRRRLRREALP